MGSILEFTIAEEAAANVDDVGQCTHQCTHHVPLGLAQAEADDLKRFDPEAFQKLEALGVTIHDVELEDFDQIGSLGHLNIVQAFDQSTAKKLYKHAIALRLDRSILISNACPEKDTLENICNAFGNDFFLL